MDGSTNSRIIDSVVRLKNGDHQAFEELYELTYNKVYFLALKVVRNQENALEIVQETYISVYKSLDKLIKPEVFNAWLSKIVINKCKDHLGKPKDILLTENEDLKDIDVIEEIEDTSSDFNPAEVLDKAETRNMIMALIDNLPDAQRTTLLLHYYQGLNVDEIAAIMECPAATVKSRLLYARRQIKAGVDGYEQQGVKLYNIGAVPLIIFILEEYAKENVLRPVAAAKILAAVKAGTHVAFASSAQTAVRGWKYRLMHKFTALSVRTKIIAGVIAGSVAITAVAIPIAVIANGNNPADSSRSKQSASGDQSSLSSTANNSYSKTSALEKDAQDKADEAYNAKLLEYKTSTLEYNQNRSSNLINNKDLSYVKYDIDKDGIPELIVWTGTCEADYVDYVYTYKNGELIYAGSLDGADQRLYALTDQNGMLALFGHMGYEAVTKVVLYNDKINSIKVIEKDVGSAEYDKFPNEITMTTVF
jgi:RNA polymerase sigma factor (sigma-70 family)